MTSELTICGTNALFLNTGKLSPNTDIEDLPVGTVIDHKLNDFVIYDES